MRIGRHLNIALLWLLVACGPALGPTRSLADQRGQLQSRLDQIAAGASSHNTLRRSRLLRALGQQEKALAELDVSLRKAREAFELPEMGRLMREIGAIQLEQGRAEEALATFGERLQAMNSLQDGAARASALVDTGYAFALLGLVGQAEDAITEARVLAEQELLADPLSAERLGIVAHLLNDPANAQELLATALVGYQKAGDQAGKARVQARRDRIAWLAQELPEALATSSVAAQRLEDPEALALVRHYQAEADLLTHRYARCEKRAIEAIKLADARGIVITQKEARVVAARCAQRNGHPKASVQRAQEAADIVDLQLRHVSGSYARQSLGAEAFKIHRLLFGLLAAHPHDDQVARAFFASERARARAHLDAVARSQLGELADLVPTSPALQRDKAEAEARMRRLTKKLLAVRQSPGFDTSNPLWALEEIREKILRSNPLLSRIAPPTTATLNMAQQTLLDGESLMLSYFVTHERVYVFSVSKTKARLHELKASRQDIGRQVRAYRKLLRQPEMPLARLKKFGQALYRKVMPPGVALGAYRKLLVVPHGSLSSLPFDSLVTDEGAFLVEKHDLRYSISTSLAVALAKRQRSGPDHRRSFVGLGDPVFNWAAFQRRQPEAAAGASSRALQLWTQAAATTAGMPKTLARLPGTSEEVRSIAKLFKAADRSILLRARATEEAVKGGALKNFRWVHIASHGLIVPPLYQSLVLTLRPDAKEDGFLMTSELSELQLDADLVVLSACNTGTTRRDASAEPVAGLALALRNAGAHRVMLSLWAVDDSATADLMLRFYRPLSKTDAAQARPDYAQHLAAAKRAMIADQRWSHPFYWAPFVLFGG